MSLNKKLHYLASKPHARTLEDLSNQAGAIVRKHYLDEYVRACSLLAPIEEAAPSFQAETGREALFQLLLANGDLAEQIETVWWDEEARIERMQRIQGCVVSALNFIERQFALDRDELGGEYYARKGYVPHALRHSRAQ